MATGPGILYVLADPGTNVTEDQFHDWYNNEHAPDRMRLPGFRSGYRYKATDGQTPPWLAIYEVDDIALLQQPIYTRLRENRSPREAQVVSQLAALDRYIYKLVASKGTFQSEPDSIAVAITLAVSTDCSSDVENWYTEEHMGMLARIPGWLRSRLLLSTTSNTPGISQYIAVHEYLVSNGLGGTEHKAAMSTPWRTRVMSMLHDGPNRRLFGLQRVFAKLPNDLEHLPSDAHSVIDSFYPRDDGVKLHYRLEGNPTGPVLVFSNSLLTDLHMWDSIIPRLAPKYKILRYDTRGHGLSPPAGNPKIADLSADILSLLSALNIPRIHAIIGVSLGGVTSLHFSLHNPTVLSRLIASDCNLASTPSNNAAWKTRIAIAESTEPNSGLPELARQTISRWFIPTSLEPQPSEAIRAVEKMIVSTSLSGFLGGAGALSDYNLREQISTLQVPALFLVGKNDGVLPEAVKEYSSKISGAKFAVIDNAGHLPMVENPESFSEAIEPFLEGTI